jgi:RNA polymerase sigma factor for flagellar operon FliA
LFLSQYIVRNLISRCVFVLQNNRLFSTKDKAMESATTAYKRASAGSRRDSLILENVDYVRKILSTLTVGLPPHCDKENLEQAGIVGLVETANSFDPARGVAFRTYAYPRIRGAIVDEMRKNSPVPQQMLEYISMVKAAHDVLDAPVTPEMLAEHTGLKLSKIQQVLEAMRFMKPQNWSDLFSNVHSSWRNGSNAPGAGIEAAEVQRIVADCIERLPERERLVLTLYFTEDLTLMEIGKVIGISESRSSRILAAAKFRLKEMVTASLE